MIELLNKLKNKNMTRIIPTFITFIFLTSALSSGHNHSNTRMPSFVYKADTGSLIQYMNRDSTVMDKLLKDLEISDSIKRSTFRKFEKNIKEIQTQQKFIDNVTRN